MTSILISNIYILTLIYDLDDPIIFLLQFTVVMQNFCSNDMRSFKFTDNQSTVVMQKLCQNQGKIYM